MLTMTFSLLVALPSFLLKNDYFFVLLVFKNFGFNCGTFNRGGTKSLFAIIYKHENLINAYLITFVSIGVAINKKYVALLNSKLTALGLDSGFHDRKSDNKPFNFRDGKCDLSFSIFIFYDLISNL